MNEEEYQSGFVKPQGESEPDLVRRTEDPTRAKHLKKPSRLKMTGDTLASFLDNRKSGNLEKAFEKYNHDYNELRRIALEVNESKSEADSKGEFTDVKDKLEEYNAQVKRLAESAVKILLFDEDIQKIKFKIDKDIEKSAARALKVPPFLIGPLKYLSSAGRSYMKKVKEDKEHAQEKLEKEIAEVVAKNAREVVGLNPSGDNIEEAAQKTMGKEEAAMLASLSDIGDVRDSVVSELTAPTPDITPVDTTSTPVEPAKESDETVEKNSQVDAGLSRKKAKKQEQRDISIQEQAMAMLAYCMKNNSIFGVDLLQNSDKSKQKLVLYAKANNGKKYLNPDMLAEIMKNTDLSSEEKVSAYNDMVDYISFAQLWQEKASFREENNDVFAFIYDAVRNGYGEDTLLVKASRELSPEKQQVLKNVIDNNFALVRRTIDTFGKIFEKVKVDAEEKDDVEVKNAQVDAGIQNRRAKGKTPKEATQDGKDDSSSHEQEDAPSDEKPVEEQVTPSVESPKVEEPEETDKGKETDNKMTFGKLNDRIRELAELKESLQKSGLSDDKSKEAIEKIDNELATLVQRVSDLLDYDKDDEKVVQGPTANSEESEPKKETDTPVDAPVVTPENVDAPKTEEPVVKPTSKVVDDSDEYSKFWGELYGKILDDPDSEKKLSSLRSKGVDFDEVEEKYAVGRHRIDVRDSEERHDKLASETREATTKKADAQVTKARKYVINELLSTLGVVPREMIDEWDQYEEEKADLGQVLKNVSETKKEEYELAVEGLASTLSESGVRDVNDNEIDFKKAITDLLDDSKPQEHRKSAVSILKASTVGESKKTI